MRAETLAHELRERVRLLDRLGAGQRDDDATVRRAQQPLGLVERVVPGDRLEPAAPHALDRIDDAVARAQVREREAALVAEPAFVDLGVVARADALHLALAHVDPSMLQPTGQRPQTVGTFWISQGRASKRYCVEAARRPGRAR